MANGNKEQKLIDFIKDLNNWRLPSYSVMCKHIGIKSKGSMFKLLKKIGANLLKENLVNSLSINNHDQSKRFVE